MIPRAGTRAGVALAVALSGASGFASGAGSRAADDPNVGIRDCPNGGETTIKGADVGWWRAMAVAGDRWLDAHGRATADVPRLLAARGVEAFRLRVFTGDDPYQSAEAVAADARAIVDAVPDASLLVDFHFSDGFADPGRQARPAAWEDVDAALRAHVADVARRLEDGGVLERVRWVQVGNETDAGMLWPDGRIDWSVADDADLTSFADLFARAADVVRDEFGDDVAVIWHHSRGDDPWVATLARRLLAAGAGFDVVGLSLYPKSDEGVVQPGRVDRALRTADAVASATGLDTMFVEFGLPPEAGAASRDLQRRLAAHPCVRGVFYWEPQQYGERGESYPLGATLPTVDGNGRLMEALDW